MIKFGIAYRAVASNSKEFKDNITFISITSNIVEIKSKIIEKYQYHDKLSIH
ncbi:MAG: hypothetical protein FWH29_05590 [Methanobrevibacter sp.]|nr:hypothetical protein [Methanobrevibacter sp.]